MSATSEAVAVLCSGGLDSVVLVAHKARRATSSRSTSRSASRGRRPSGRVLSHPRLRRRRSAAASGPLVLLDMTMRDVYPASHWAMRGTPPAYDTPDEDVYLAGRNIVLLSKAGVYCAGAGIHRLAIGPLAGNPFPDATPAFFERHVRRAVAGPRSRDRRSWRRLRRCTRRTS